MAALSDGLLSAARDHDLRNFVALDAVAGKFRVRHARQRPEVLGHVAGLDDAVEEVGDPPAEPVEEGRDPVDHLVECECSHWSSPSCSSLFEPLYRLVL